MKTMQEETNSYYEVLGISEDASQEDIKSAYRKLVKQYHPDIYKGEDAETKTKKINEAYETLSDEDKRRRYDNKDIMGGFNFGGFNLSDFMNFGNMRGDRSRTPQHGSDVVFDVVLTLEEVCTKDLKKTIKFKRYKNCIVCSGSGFKKDAKPTKCLKCLGKGMVVEEIVNKNQVIQNIYPCPKCKGSGKIYIETDKCSDCKGSGHSEEEISKEIEIPAGVATGQGMQMQSFGHAGKNGGPCGNLVVRFLVKKHDIFERNGQDLFADLNIGYADAILGTTKDFPTISGKVIKVKIPKCTKNDTILRYRNLGCPSLEDNDNLGDLYIRVGLNIPDEKNITEEYMNCVKKLAEFEKTLDFGNKNIDNYLEKKSQLPLE